LESQSELHKELEYWVQLQQPVESSIRKLYNTLALHHHISALSQNNKTKLE